MTDSEQDPIYPVSSSSKESAGENKNETGIAQPENAGESSSPVPPAPSPSAEDPRIKPLKRFDTMPSRRNQMSPDAPRRRGRTLTSQVPENDVTLPKRQITRRGTAIVPGGRIGIIPDRAAAASPIAQRDSISTGRPRASSSGLRPRLSQSGGRPRESTLQRRPTVALAATGVDTGAENFSLAGPPPVEAAIVPNQPYVDPGYTQLNPAYDQPENIRPVWGLAKPLPRVVRPGMIPTRSEVNAAQQAPPPADVDLEAGRIEPTLKLNRISTQLQNARQQREKNLLEAHGLASPSTQQGLSNAEPLTAPSQVIEEEPELHKTDDGDVTPPERPLDRPASFDGVRSHNSQVDRFPSFGYPDDAASEATQTPGDGDLDGDWIGEEVPLKAYDPNYDDEIHNLHTHWSVIRLRFREPLAELLAVTVQLTLGFCADLAVTTSSKNTIPAGNEVTTDFAWGFASMLGIYIAGGISGAHLNPAISIMLWIYRGFPLRKVPMYVLAQILGGFLAALIAFGLYQRNILEYGGANLANGNTSGSFITYPRFAWINQSTAFFNEFTGTAILAIAVLALGDDMNAPPGAGMSAFIMALVVTVLSMAFGYNTGAAMNPSRDLGPRLALCALGYGTDLFTNVYWIWGNWCAPITGAIFGAFLYDAAIFAGGESPVNYPRKRIKRAGHKWRRRWGHRLRSLKPKRNNNNNNNNGDEKGF
ncbi:Aquaporin-4 [Clarireedia jacksonii]